MSKANIHRHQPPIAKTQRAIQTILDWLSWGALMVAPPVLRITLALPFFRSGLTRWDGFLQLAPSATYLFEEEFKLHIFGGQYAIPAPDVVAHLTGMAEIVLPILLILGFATRLSAAGLLVMTGVIQLVVLDGWANFHLYWAAIALAIIALGAGPLSVDRLIAAWTAKDRPMTNGPPSRAPHLRLVTNEAEQRRVDRNSEITRDVDWSILMARAQGGDGASYRRLLEDIIPYLRSLAARCHRERSDVEDAVQDVLLTVHAIRATYDPARPFGPWLLAIANRRLIDRLRRQGRRKSLETPFATEHENLPDKQANTGATADHGRLDEAIGRLSHGQRRAIRLLKLKEMPLKEAAIETGLSVTSLKVSAHRGMISLRKMLGEQE